MAKARTKEAPALTAEQKALVVTEPDTPPA